jgi:hypothetical protein
MKKLFILCVLFVSFQVKAAIISLLPATNNLAVGDIIVLDVIISQLAPGGDPSLGGFDLNVHFNSAVLVFDTADIDINGIFDNITLDPDFQLDVLGLGINFLSTQMLSAGVLNMFELSFDLPFDLDALQANSFTLARITFGAIQAGTSTFSVIVNALSDAHADPLNFTTQDIQITVSGNTATPIAEPSQWLLLMLALGFIVSRGTKPR